MPGAEPATVRLPTNARVARADAADVPGRSAALRASAAPRFPLFISASTRRATASGPKLVPGCSRSSRSSSASAWCGLPSATARRARSTSSSCAAKRPGSPFETGGGAVGAGKAAEYAGSGVELIFAGAGTDGAPGSAREKVFTALGRSASAASCGLRASTGCSSGRGLELRGVLGADTAGVGAVRSAVPTRASSTAPTPVVPSTKPAPSHFRTASLAPTKPVAAAEVAGLDATAMLAATSARLFRRSKLSSLAVPALHVVRVSAVCRGEA